MLCWLCAKSWDAWYDSIHARLLHVQDLHADDAVYYQACSFSTNKSHQHLNQVKEALKERKNSGRHRMKEHKHS